ncbi:MAG: (d)CMP kinase [Bacteroidota bacterium]
MITIAIDGYAACGKSSTAKGVAAALEYLYIDTGAMYRSVSLHFLREGIGFQAETDELKAAVADLKVDFVREGDQLLTRLNGEVVEDAIRRPEISAIVSPVAVHASVREAMVAQQRAMGARGGVVMDGRDIGTVVFPHAELKVFVTAEMEVRAKRRLVELQSRGIDSTLEAVIENLRERDHIDSTREIAPLRQAADALVLDTTHMTLQGQIDQVVAWARAVMAKSTQ